MPVYHTNDGAGILTGNGRDAVEKVLRELDEYEGLRIRLVTARSLPQDPKLDPLAVATLFVATEPPGARLLVRADQKAVFPELTLERIEAMAVPKTASEHDTTARIEAAVRQIQTVVRLRHRPSIWNSGDPVPWVAAGLVAVAVVAFIKWRLPPPPRLTLEETEAARRKSRAAWALFFAPTTLAIIAGNLVPLAGVLFFGWNVFPLLILFWLESLVIIAMDAMRVLFARPGDRSLWLQKLVLVPASLLVPLAFSALQVGVIFSVFMEDSRRARGEWWSVHDMVTVIAGLGLWLPLALIAAAHLFRFLSIYIAHGEFRREGAEKWDRSLGRIVMLQVAMILGAGGVQALGTPIWALAVLVLLKMAGETLGNMEKLEGSAINEKQPNAVLA